MIVFALFVEWPVQFGAFMVIGFGLYLLHGFIQVQVTELVPTMRGAAMSLHSSSYFMGQAAGPIVYGFAFAQVGSTTSIIGGAFVILAVGITCAIYPGSPAGDAMTPDPQGTFCERPRTMVESHRLHPRDHGLRCRYRQYLEISLRSRQQRRKRLCAVLPDGRRSHRAAVDVRGVRDRTTRRQRRGRQHRCRCPGLWSAAGLGAGRGSRRGQRISDPDILCRDRWLGPGLPDRDHSSRPAVGDRGKRPTAVRRLPRRAGSHDHLSRRVPGRDGDDCGTRHLRRHRGGVQGPDADPDGVDCCARGFCRGDGRIWRRPSTSCSTSMCRN